MFHHLFSRTSQPYVPFDADRVVLRHAHEGDIEALARLELLEGRRLPTADVVVAEADGELLAAADPRSGATVADPFRPTATIVRMLRTWATT